MGKICTSLAQCIAAIYDGKLTIADIDMVYEGTIIGDEQNYGEWAKRYSFIENTAKSVEILKQLVTSNKVTVMAHQCKPDDTIYSVSQSSDGLDVELHELEKNRHPKYATKINGKLYEFHPTRTILARNDWADSIEELIGGELREAFMDQIATYSNNILDFSSNERIAMMKIAFPQYTEVINTIIRQYSEVVEQSTERNGQIESIKYDEISRFSKNIPSLFETLVQEKENDELKMQMVSFNEIKGLCDEGIIKPYEEFCKDRDIRKFNNKNHDICSTIQIDPGDNPRWRIVGGKNLFGLRPTVSTDGNNTQMFLVPCIGKFRLDRFIGLFKWQNAWDISDISSRSGESKYKELREFYHMNNRQVFEKFGLELSNDTEQDRLFITNALLLDSLLNDRYSDIIHFGTTERNCSIKLSDGTTIEVYNAPNRNGITIRNEKSKGSVKYTSKSIASIADEGTNFVTHLDQLVVDDVKYTGDERIVEQLQRAMRENFMLQRQHSAVEIGQGVGKNLLPRDVTETLMGIRHKKKSEPNRGIPSEYDK